MSDDDWETCPECGGEGELYLFGMPDGTCDLCNGYGYVEVNWDDVATDKADRARELAIENATGFEE